MRGALLVKQRARPRRLKKKHREKSESARGSVPPQAVGATRQPSAGAAPDRRPPPHLGDGAPQPTGRARPHARAGARSASAARLLHGASPRPPSASTRLVASAARAAGPAPRSVYRETTARVVSARRPREPSPRNLCLAISPRPFQVNLLDRVRILNTS